MTERKKYSYELYQEWKNSGMSQKDFLATKPKENEYGSVSASLAIGRRVYAYMERQKESERRIAEYKKQQEKDHENYVYNPYFEKIFEAIMATNARIEVLESRIYTLCRIQQKILETGMKRECSNCRYYDEDGYCMNCGCTVEESTHVCSDWESCIGD